MHRAAITEVRLLNWLKAGRGQGFGEDYQAWIQATRQDHASTGMSSLLVTPCFERQHHTLSSIESSIATTNLAVPCVKDLREQFPLWPFAHPSPVIALDEYHGQALSEPEASIGTVALAKQLRITHANFRGLRIKYIYTTDQLLTIVLANGLRKLLAISIKCRADLRKKKGRRRLFQKLRLERAYWRSLGVHWFSSSL